MRGAGHYSVRRGKRVLVLRRNGEHFVATFKKFDDKEIFFSDHDPIRTNQVRTLSIYKGQSHRA